MAADEPPAEYRWTTPGTWPEWYSAHRDARAELLCTAREDDTHLVHIRINKDEWIPALRELARLQLIEFFELESWDAPREQWHPIAAAEASALLEIPGRWEPESGEPRVVFAITEKGLRAAEAEAFHFNDGRFIAWHDEGS